MIDDAVDASPDGVAAWQTELRLCAVQMIDRISFTEFRRVKRNSGEASSRVRSPRYLEIEIE